MCADWYDVLAQESGMKNCIPRWHPGADIEYEDDQDKIILGFSQISS